MITRDFLLRQLHQLTQALVQVLAKKQQGQHEEARQMAEAAVAELAGTDRLYTLSRADLLALCTSDGHLNADMAVALADLIRESAPPGAGDQLDGQADDEARLLRERALWLYEAALQSGETVPLDIHDRMAGLRPPAP